jgi:putative PIN family toxin of toxin-antitoxin system
MGTTKTVIDTNVIISAVRWGGIPRQVFEQITLDKSELIMSYEQLLEVEHTARYPRLNLSPADIEVLMEFIKITFTLVYIPKKLNVIKEDPSDNIILETATDHNAEYVISGDKHLLKLKQYKNIKIVTPKEFLLKTGRIAQDREGHAAWIWDPEGVKRYLARKDLMWKPNHRR